MNGEKGNTLERGRQPVKFITVPVNNPDQGGKTQQGKSGTTTGGSKK